MYLDTENKSLLAKTLMKLCQNLCKNNMMSFWIHGEKELHGRIFIRKDIFLL